jgi:hypothetical protein
MAAALCLLCGGATLAHAQRRGVVRATANGRVVGTVYDTLGTPVAGAMIRVERTDVRAQSGPTGEYVLNGTRIGRAKVVVERAGFPALVLDAALTGVDTLDVILFGAAPVSAATQSAPPSQDARSRVDSLVPPSGGVSALLVPRIGTSAASAPSIRRQPRTLRGVVTDTTGAPLVGAVIEIVTLRRTTLTDSAGRFALTGLASGAALVRVRRIGYAQGSFTTTISDEDAVIAEISMGSLGQILNRVTVRENALASPRLAAFAARKKSGFGQYVTRDEFVDRNPRVFSDLMLRFTGVAAANDSRGRKRIYGRGKCEMAVFLNGMRMLVPEGTGVDDFLDVYDIEAVEVHSGVGTVPPEFSGQGSACGVVAAWTRIRNGR